MREREKCLEEAKAVLLEQRAVGGDESSNDDFGSNKITLLTDLYDRLCDFLSVFSSTQDYQEQNAASTTVSSSLLDTIVGCLKWSTSNDKDDANQMRTTLQTEADLYRALWLTSLYILATTTAKTMSNHQRCHEFHSEINETLKTTIRQCDLLVRLLEKMLQKHYSGGKLHNMEVKNDHQENVWDQRIRQWTEENCDVMKIIYNGHDDDDDDENNHLIISKEQLELEEEELLRMADAPTPYETQQQKPQPQQPWPHITDLDQMVATNKLTKNPPLIARLLSVEPSCSLSCTCTIRVALNERGILQQMVPTSTDTIETRKTESGKQLWTVTSQSNVTVGTNSQLRISDVVSVTTGEVQYIMLNVGREGHLWWDRISRFVVEDLNDVRSSQKDIVKLWPSSEITNASMNARNMICTLIELPQKEDTNLK